MKISFLTVIIFLFAVATTFAQTHTREDSLKNELQKAKGEKRLEILNQLFDDSKLSDFDKALGYATQYNELALASGDSLKMVQGGRMRAFSLMDLGGNEEAIKSLLFVLGVTKRNQDKSADFKKQIKSILNNLGLCYLRIGNYAKSLEYHYQSLAIREAEGDKKSIRAALNNIGLVFYNLEDFEQAIKYYLRAIKLSEEINDFEGMENVFINLGLCYDGIKMGDKAIETIQKVFVYCKNNCNDDLRKRVFCSLGYAYLTKHDLVKARENFMIALEISQKQGDAQYLNESLMGLFDIEFELGNDKHALNYLKEAGPLVESSKIAGSRLIFYSKSSLFYQTHKDYEKSLLYLRKYLSLKDSMYRLPYIKDLPKVEAGYEQRANLRKIEEDTKILSLQKEIIARQEKQFYLTAAIASLIAILLFVSFYFSRKLKAQNLSIHQKNEDLIKLNHEKNNLIGVVAHDLRGPLNLIKWLSSLIKARHKADDESAEYLTMMEQSTRRLDEMVSKILDVEAIEASGAKVNIEPVNFSDIVRRVVDRYQNDAARKSIKINEQITDGTTVQADQAYAEQVLENLVSNAIKFSPAEKNIYVIVTQEKDKAICEIRDEGPGLSEEDKKYLFGKYQKLSAKPTGDETSVGLGLSIVKKFVDAMHGEVWCESQENRGASFFLKFSLAPADR